MNEIGASSITPLGHIEQWDALALDYLEGDVTPVARAEVEAHLAACPACRALLEDQRVMAAALHAIEPARPPQHLEEAVLASLGVAASARTPAVNADLAHAPAARRPQPAVPSFLERLRAYLRPRSVAVAAAALVLVVVGALTLSSRPDLLQTDSAGSPARTTLAANTTVLSTQAAQAGLSAEENAPTTTEGSAQTTLATAPTTPRQVAAGTTTTAPQTPEPPTTVPLDVMAKYMGVPEPTWVEVAQDGAGPDAIASAFGSATGLEPLPADFWMGGPTFAVVASVSHVAGLMDHLQRLGFRVTPGNQPVDTLGNALNGILAGYATYHRAEVVDETLTLNVAARSLPENEAALLVFVVTQ